MYKTKSNEKSAEKAKAKVAKHFYNSRRSFSALLRRANAIKVWTNAIKMPDQHKYE